MGCILTSRNMRACFLSLCSGPGEEKKKDSYLQTGSRHWICWKFDLGHPAFIRVRNTCLLFKPLLRPHLWYFVIEVASFSRVYVFMPQLTDLQVTREHCLITYFLTLFVPNTVLMYTHKNGRTLVTNANE